MRITFILSALLALLVFVACKQNDMSVPALTGMKFTNAYPGYSFDIYSNDSKLVSGLGYDTSSAYAYGEPKIYSIKVTQANSETSLIDGIQQLQAGQKYSMFLIPVLNDSSTALQTNKVASVILNDTTSVPNIDTFKIRILDFAPFSPIMNVAFSQDGRTARADTIWATPLSRYFNDQETYSSRTAYIQIRAGVWHVNFLDASKTVITPFITRATINFSSRKIYTLYIRGSVTNSAGYSNLASKLITQN